MDSTSYRTLSIVISSALILALIVGFYWGIAVKPKKKYFWSRVNSVSHVSSAKLSYDEGEVANLSSDISGQLFDDIRNGESYSPNHPSSVQKGVIAFETDQGEISWEFSITREQGGLFYAHSNVTSGWSFGVRRSDLNIDVFN